MVDISCNIIIIAALCMYFFWLDMLSVGNAWAGDQAGVGGGQEQPEKKPDTYLISRYGFPIPAEKVEAFEACCYNLATEGGGWQWRHPFEWEIKRELPKYLHDPNARVVAAALVGLRRYGYGQLKDEAFKDKICELLKSEDARIRARTILLVGGYLQRSYIRPPTMPYVKPPIPRKTVVEAIVSVTPSEDRYYEEMLLVLTNKELVEGIPVSQRMILLDSLKEYFDKLANNQYFDSHIEEAVKRFSGWKSNPAEHPPNPEIITKAKERARRELFRARRDVFRALWTVGGKGVVPWLIERLPRKVAYDKNGYMQEEISCLISSSGSMWYIDLSYADMSYIDPLIKALSKRADKPKEAKEWYEKTNTLWTVWSILTKKKRSKEGTREFCHLCARLLKSKNIKEREAAIEVFAKWQNDSRTMAMLKEAEVNLDLTKQEAEALVKAGLKPEVISALTGKE